MPDKERERYYLSQLRTCVSDLPDGTPIEREPPDFVLGSAPDRVGVEFTEFHLAPAPGQRPFREVQSLKEQVVSTAQTLFAQAGGPALYVTVIFGPHGRLAKQSTARVARDLANALLSIQVPRSVREPSIDVPRDMLPREIAKVHAHGSVDGEDLLWQCDNVGWVTSLTSTHVQEEIDRKHRIVAASRKDCERLWLVIVHSLTRSAFSELSMQARTATYSYSFDRVFWLEPHSPHVHELNRPAD